MLIVWKRAYAQAGTPHLHTAILNPTILGSSEEESSDHASPVYDYQHCLPTLPQPSESFAGLQIVMD